MRFALIVILTILVPSVVFADGDSLQQVNAQRAARGLPPFTYDPALSQAAYRAAAFRASYGLFGHTANDFSFLSQGSSADAAGCAAYPASYGFMACCTYENYRYAGAASVTGPDGRQYHHIFVSNAPPATSDAQPKPTTVAPVPAPMAAPCGQAGFTYAASSCGSTGRFGFRQRFVQRSGGCGGQTTVRGRFFFRSR